jgi:ribokinase
MTRQRRTVVVGSINADLSVRVAALPRAGETVVATSLTRSTGGKGANAAVAAARLGADVLMFGAVGDDEEGRAAKATMTATGIDCAGVTVHPAATGLALITVNSDGENFVQVVAGANEQLRASHLSERLPHEPSVLLMSLELPDEPLLAAAAAQQACGGTVILNLSPTRPFDPQLIASSSILLVNEPELRAIYGAWPGSDAEWLTARADLRAQTLVVTLGADGAIAVGAPGIVHAPGIPVNVVDTTGCGDAFAGALAARLANGGSTADAVMLGTQVGAYAAAIAGTQASYPTQADLSGWLPARSRVLADL